MAEMTLSADALAVGEDTLTVVDALIDLVDRGPVTIGRGKVEALAATEDGFASADTDATATGDIIIINTRSKSDAGYEISITKVKVIDVEVIDGRTKLIYNEQDTSNEEFAIDLEGNAAIASGSAQASGEDTLAIVDAFALAVEDTLSQSTITATAAV